MSLGVTPQAGDKPEGQHPGSARYLGDFLTDMHSTTLKLEVL